ncbi:hypothetical protein LCGC14_2120120 [marine sediment metagenome]|uniref:Uncharacterized protein n=1 Tax=marine sediment metagenome TaxID=412755 RepID=A0A0F9ERL9_9ZZZZ
MKKYLFIALLSISLFWGSQAKAAESPIASTKAIEALVTAFSFNTDGTIDMTITGSMTGVDLTLTGDLTTSLTANSVPFIGASGILTEDTTGLIYDGTAMAIGTATANATGLHVHVAAAGGEMVADSNADDLVVEGSASTGITILYPNADNGNIYFGTPNDSIGALIRWEDNDDLMTIGVDQVNAGVAFISGSSVEAMRIDSDQNVLIGTATAGASMVGGIGLGNATPASAIIQDGILLWAEDSGTNTLSTLAILTEEGTSTLQGSTLDTKIVIRVNGADYWLHLDKLID